MSPVVTEQVTVLRPVLAGHQDDLATYLAGLGTQFSSPFNGRLPPTHFARFVVVWRDRTAPDVREPPHLFFSARFDGPARAYLEALAATPEACVIFGHCELPPGVSAGDPIGLAAHLLDRRTRVATQYTISLVPDGMPVATVNQALELREQLRMFLLRRATGPGGSLDLTRDPVALIHDLRQLPAVRRLTNPG